MSREYCLMSFLSVVLLPIQGVIFFSCFTAKPCRCTSHGGLRLVVRKWTAGVLSAFIYVMKEDYTYTLCKVDDKVFFCRASSECSRELSKSFIRTKVFVILSYEDLIIIYPSVIILHTYVCNQS